MSLIGTIKQEIRAKYPNGLDKQEHRTPKRGLLEVAMRQTASPDTILTQSVKDQIAGAMDRAVKIPVIKRKDMTLKNVRSCTIVPFENDTALVSVVQATAVIDFTMVRAQYNNNHIDYLNDFRVKEASAVRAFADKLEEVLYAQLNTAKSTVYNSTIPVTAPYSIALDTIQVPTAAQEFFFNDAHAIQNSDDFYGNMDVVGSTNLMPLVMRYINQGSSNSTNTNFQFNGYNFTFSNKVIDAALKTSTGFIIPSATIAIMTTTDFDSKRGSKTTNGVEWSTERLDGFPFNVGVMYKSECSDETALAVGSELKATELQSFQISFDYTTLVAYNSDPATYAGGIKKFEMVV